MSTLRGSVFSVLILAIFTASTALAAPYDNPNGYTHVVCLNNSQQSYELYIPPSAPATNRPILYVFDPGGYGKGALIWLAPVAAANGWVLAASNNSKNGPWADIFTAQDALIADTEARWNLHATRRFAAGFSGGARASLALAFRYPSKICGTLCMGAGWPINTTLTPSNSSLVVRILIGTEDSNIDYDIPHTQKLLEPHDIRCEVSTYSGGHVWPSDPLVLSAGRWLNENAQRDPNAGANLQSCSGPSDFEQSPPPLDDQWLCAASDTYSGVSMYEDFHGVNGPISRVQWCGISGRYCDYYNQWFPCESDSNTFVMSFHPDAGGLPGPAVYEQTLTAERVDGPGVYGGDYVLRHFSARLSSPVTLASGWVCIKQVASSSALNFWLISSPGVGGSLLYEQGVFTALPHDLALCLSSDALECAFTASTTLCKPQHTVQFQGTVTGALGEDVTWHWDFGDGTTYDGNANPAHTYATDGIYTVTVTVTTPTRTVTQTLDSVIRVTEALPAISPTAACALCASLLIAGSIATTRRRSAKT